MSTEEKPSEEPNMEYKEVAHGKRKLKSAITSHVSKKLALLKDKTDTSKVGKKGIQVKNNPQPKVQASNPSPTKSRPLFPLTVGSLNMPAFPESECFCFYPSPAYFKILQVQQCNFKMDLQRTWGM